MDTFVSHFTGISYALYPFTEPDSLQTHVHALIQANAHWACRKLRTASAKNNIIENAQTLTALVLLAHSLCGAH